jgi:hypothetical protein
VFQITELKNDLEDSSISSPRSAVSSILTADDEGPRIFQGNVRSASRDEIIDALPPRELVDAFVSNFFLQREHIPSKPLSFKFALVDNPDGRVCPTKLRQFSCIALRS